MARGSMFRPLRHALDRIVTTGYLRLIDAQGLAHAFGNRSGAPIVAHIMDRRTERLLVVNPTLALGEAYMDGRLVMERGTIYDFLELILANLDYASWPRWAIHRTDGVFLSRRGDRAELTKDQFLDRARDCQEWGGDPRVCLR